MIGRLFPYFFAIALFTGCRSSSASTEEDVGKVSFTLPEIPGMIVEPAERDAFLLSNYWNNFNFKDSLSVLSNGFEKAFVNYIVLLQRTPGYSSYIASSLDSASRNHNVFVSFVNLYGKYLYNPNSPLRNETLYISVLQYLLASDAVDDQSKPTYKFRLDLAMKNRPGEAANNFDFTTEKLTDSGERIAQISSMYGIKADYLLIFFNNPDCMDCGRVKEYIKGSGIFNTMQRSGGLKILSLFPDTDIELWRNSEYPKEWINGYDTKHIVTDSLLYDLRAIPTLYLLDRNKNVVLKDATIERIEAFFADGGQK